MPQGRFPFPEGRFIATMGHVVVTKFSLAGDNTQVVINSKTDLSD